MDTFMRIMEWLIPAGGLAGGLTWFLNKTLRNLRTTKEMHDTYKTMYEDNSKTLIELQHEITELHKELVRFRRAFSRASTCRYYANCPIKHELLREQTVDTKPKGRKRQRTGQGSPDSEIRADPGIESESVDTGQ